MVSLAPAFRFIDCIAGLNLNYRKCWWSQYGDEEHDLWGLGSRKVVKNSAKCKLFDTTNLLEPWLAQMDTIIVGQHTRKKLNQRVMKMNASSLSLVELLCDLKINAISVRSFIGSVCAPDKVTLKGENHALQCTTTGPYNAVPSSLLLVGSLCGVGPDLVGIHSIILEARCWVAACSLTLRRGLEKSMRHAGTIALLSLLFLTLGNKRFIHALDIVCRVDRDDTLDEVPQNKKQKVAINLLVDKLRTQDFAGSLSRRASRVQGPINRRRASDILPHMKIVSRASRLGLLVCFFRILCKGPCAARRFHTAENDDTCRIGCPDEADSLSLITMRVPGCITSFYHSGDMLRSCHQETARYTTWSSWCSCGAFNMVL